MYTRYFGLEEKPFAISPNPRYLFMSELHREALAHLLYGINSDGCFILLTGDVGTGKTTVCRCLLTQLPEHTDVAIILNPKLTASELLRTICEELGILLEGDAGSMKTYVDVLNRHLLTAYAKGRTTAIIIDEAQNLDMDVLEQLRLLTNLETNTQKLLQIVLIGQPELRDILERPELSQLNQRVTSRYHLTPLSPEEVHSYILHRLSVADGKNKRLFSPKAIKYIARITGGIPRRINVLCDRALLGAYAENEDHVSYDIIRKAGSEVFSQQAGQRSVFREPATIAGLMVVFCLLLTMLYFSPFFKELIAVEPQPANVEEIEEPAKATASAAETEKKPAQAADTEPANQAVNPAIIQTAPLSNSPPDEQPNEQIDAQVTPDRQQAAKPVQPAEQEAQQGVLIARAEIYAPVDTDVYQPGLPNSVQVSPPKHFPTLEHSSIIQNSRQPDNQ
ncbi:AAA family ATPase [Desulfosediminicola sp.]|uniref:AAA family ATPase n=1 Tax=Desulfosediminicola sp. TaxID=2886825 RepID=UPI003AF20D5B